MRVYSLTKLGKEVTKDSASEGEEIQVLRYLRNNKTATEDQLEVVGGERYVMRRLVGQNLVKELTS